MLQGNGAAHGGSGRAVASGYRKEGAKGKKRVVEIYKRPKRDVVAAEDNESMARGVSLMRREERGGSCERIRGGYDEMI
jgi:hypothetical protein